MLRGLALRSLIMAVAALAFLIVGQCQADQKAAIGRVSTRDASGQPSFGSGVTVAIDEEKRQAVALTCHHVIGNASRVWFWPAEHRQAYACQVRYTNPGDDIAALVYSYSEVPIVAYVAASEPRPGQQAVGIGYPNGGNTARKNIGPVSFARLVGMQTEWKFASAAGQSGGPIFSGGELVGLISGTDPYSFENGPHNGSRSTGPSLEAIHRAIEKCGFT